MDATTAMNHTDEIVTGLIGRLTPEHRTAPTPCSKWNVHDVIDHMCSGGTMIAGGLEGAAPPSDAPDYLIDGPAAGWSGTVAHMRAAATPEALAATHQMPFGEVPGEVALSVIVADQLTHAWDLATAISQTIEIDPDVAEWALATWQAVVPAEGRTGDGFAAAVPIDDAASPVDRLVAYTGRQP